eukprot:3588250-Rhodomonas_salina.2
MPRQGTMRGGSPLAHSGTIREDFSSPGTLPCPTRNFVVLILKRVDHSGAVLSRGYGATRACVVRRVFQQCVVSFLISDARIRIRIASENEEEEGERCGGMR